MISEEKIKEARKKLRRGEPGGELRERLLKEGYTEDDLKIVFKPHHYDMRKWYLTFALLISAVGLYQVIKTGGGGMLMLILGVLLFGAWYYEEKRLANLSQKSNTPDKDS